VYEFDPVLRAYRVGAELVHGLGYWMYLQTPADVTLGP